MRKLISLFLCMLILAALPASVAGEPSTFWKTVPGNYRGAATSGELAITEAGSAVEHTLNAFGSEGESGNMADYFEIYYKATTGTNPLHVQIFKGSSASPDSTYTAPSSVFLVYPETVKPFPIKGVYKIKINLTETGEVGIAVIDYFKL